MKDELIHEEFRIETVLMNFNRLRIFNYLSILLVLIQLYSDFFLGNFWSTYQVSKFMFLDIELSIFTVVYLFITLLSRPKKSFDIKPWHSFAISFFIIHQLLWASGISVFESSSANSTPTYIIAIYAASIVFLTRAIPFLIYLIISLGILYLGLISTGMQFNQIFTQYSQLAFLIVIAWVISRILMNSRVETFSNTKALETARNSLDTMIKERTLELSSLNQKLIEEIKERNRYEKKLELEKKKAEEADRIKSVFLANISHEIRTPLNGILGFSDLLRNPGLKKSKKEHYLEIIGKNGHQLLKIIDDVLDISMIESNQLKMNNVGFHLSNLLPLTIDFFNDYLNVCHKEHLLLINKGFPSASQDYVYSDPSRVQQILYNLIDNAIKFTRKGKITLGGYVEENFALIYVEDTGIGVDPELCPAIFERFRQGEESSTRAYGGTGLGLSISKGLIEKMGGMIWVDFNYKPGARFCFSLPINHSIVTISAAKLAVNLKKRKKECIIISDELPENYSFLSHFFECNILALPKFDYKSFSTNLPDNIPELILLELNKSNGKSENLLTRIREYAPGVPVIAIQNEYISFIKQSNIITIPANPLNMQLLITKMYALLNNMSIGE